MIAFVDRTRRTYDLGTLAGEQLGDRLSDAPAGAGYNCNFTL